MLLLMLTVPLIGNVNTLFDITSEQVQYLDGRIGDFAAAFEDASGCHPSHPIYAACQVTLTADNDNLYARNCLAYATWPLETRGV